MIPPELSVVVLCYRAESFIKNFVQQIETELGQESISYELILVANYDSSNDSSPALVNELAKTNNKIIPVTRPKEGKMGWDMRTGLAAASGQYIAIIDGDGQMPVTDLSVVYNIIKNGGYDLVKTYRAVRNDGWWRSLLSKIYNLLFSLLFHPGFPVRDINSKPKILTRQAYTMLNLQSNDWFTDAEIMIQAFEKKLRICEVSTIFYKNERRASFVGPETIFEFIYNLIHYRLKKK